MKKYALSLLTLTMALSSSAAFAVIGDTQTETKVITFNEVSSVRHTLTPQTNLNAGPQTINTVVASGVIESPPASTVLVQWVTVGTGSGATRQFTRVGGSDTVDLILNTPGSYQHDVEGNGIRVRTTQMQSELFGYQVALANNRDVIAGDYQIQISAQAYAA
ncbi:hypothetical protein BD65_267 [Yersinia ruckeri]|uniref:hypothetical protein n=1 Tax=Yersinia ruckeri TaxID=29486 RepID=UPI0005ACA8FC|nr:hypothetical protein [Yersinia ruckeri]AJI96512.1 hypothetical protein BD65_267 [Yersinia ruckeri]